MNTFGRAAAICALTFSFCTISISQSKSGSVFADGQDGGALRKFLQNYLMERSDGPDRKTTRYVAAFVHLRDDGWQQVIVYLMGRDWCGSGGCVTLVLVRKDSSYAVITKMTIVQRPIRVLDSKTNGWHDLGVWVQGGGIQPGYEDKLSFNGKKYRSNPTVPPAQPLVGEVSGKIVVSRDDDGDPLYGEK